MIPWQPIRRSSFGDNRPDWARPEIVAAEQRILTYADALLTFMRRITETDPEFRKVTEAFMTHNAQNPLREDPHRLDASPVTAAMLLDKMGVDENRLMLELMRAAWERRAWQLAYKERQDLTK